jgi:hypothetical protein
MALGLGGQERIDRLDLDGRLCIVYHETASASCFSEYRVPTSG